MVGIVIVSHSRELARDVRDMALQMCGDQDVVVSLAGGMDDGTFGTSFEKIEHALQAADTDEGVVVLMDLGSAVMTAQMVLEMLAPEKRARVRLCNAPLVEGALAAAANAAAGGTIDEVQRAAERALIDTPKIQLPVNDSSKAMHPPTAIEKKGASPASLDLVVTQPDGLHARPAMRIVQAAAAYQSHITIQNLTQKRPPVDAKMPMQVAFGGTARQGETIRLTAAGIDADEALASLRGLVEKDFQASEIVPPNNETLAETAAGLTEAPLKKCSGRLKGIGASEGWAVGPAFIYASNRSLDRSSAAQGQEMPEKEVERLKNAIGQAKEALTRIQAKIEAALDRETGWIFAFQRMILEDTLFVESMERSVLEHQRTAEDAVRDGFAVWKAKAAGLDEIMQVRAGDLQDVENRLLAILGGGREPADMGLSRPAIIVAADLSPSDVAQLDRRCVLGMATVAGGTTSHTAILARTWGIPAVMGLDETILSLDPQTRLALDGTHGILEVDPPQKIISTYLARADQQKKFLVQARAQAHGPAVTRDGKHTTVLANVGDLDSAHEALDLGADGIGLLRTEFLYLNRTVAPTENEQFRVYRNIADIMGNKPVIVRTLDAGADKPMPFLNMGSQPNPSLGMRAIRFCLRRPEIFQPQLRAILRAAVAGNIKIMFPMISSLAEVAKAKDALAEAADALRSHGIEHAGQIEVGIMIETPAAALCVDKLAAAIDFMSIGSNDLTQYTLACDRGSPDMRDVFDTWHPAVLQLIQHVIERGHSAGKSVGLCGTFAGQEKALPLLLRWGLDTFSVAPGRVPTLKQRIRGMRI